MCKHKRVQRYTNFLKGRDFALWCVEITGFFIKKKTLIRGINPKMVVQGLI